MARNRKRAKERRARRPPGPSRRRPARAEPTERADPTELAEAQLEPAAPIRTRDEDAEPAEAELAAGRTAAMPGELPPDPLQHAAPNVEQDDG